MPDKLFWLTLVLVGGKATCAGDLASGCHTLTNESAQPNGVDTGLEKTSTARGTADIRLDRCYDGEPAVRNPEICGSLIGMRKRGGSPCDDWTCCFGH